ncbi:MAG: outer membrane protein OmpA-like peptidoglycan-associated protein [Oceanicoccus sp.]|jgi:outer membrane protein OmpA-like peptidoglycan-associated protein
MKMSTFIPALSLCFAASTIAVADSMPTGNDAKRVGLVSASMLVGIASLGPIGVLPGLLAGAWLDQEVLDADRVEDMDIQLTQANSQLRDMGEKLTAAQLSTEEYARIALEQLQLELLFKTNNSALTEHGVKRLTFLANFLSENPAIHVRLDGYADPRGDAQYNQDLSNQRVASVYDLLVANGVNHQRIEKYSYGASQSLSAVGDYDSYALERVVKIQLFQQHSDAFAGITVSN